MRLPIGLTVGTPPDVLAVAAIKRTKGHPDPPAMPIYGRRQLRRLPCREALLTHNRACSLIESARIFSTFMAPWKIVWNLV